MSQVDAPMTELTEARRVWLTKLRDDGPAKRQRNKVGYECMTLGWTEWNARDAATGAALSKDEALGRMYARLGHTIEHSWLERITDAGLRALLAWERGENG